ncbi:MULTISPECIES: MFS transporter [Paenibacillus]|uniref:Putative proline/betaine transporter n=1 Tax=Paenibacillus naphthalenovorans TaxID=162209 RepID=A0A0U2U595_9BACL|nr:MULTISPECIES: MFS transporter [Paenibacillus]ALS21416.1 proline/betaine transporter [Paenibacillus naphthalenovorans]GCL72676.1 MFS transporter [Paenibacillus naphthalenovorans]SDJ54321.1 metabolite-proton symporter [Paenibacillus naphthalenovorans]
MAQVQIAAPPEINKKKANRALLASMVGSSIEWFDFFLYGSMAALVFNKLYFPSDDPIVGLLLAYMSFGLSFFIRPLGGIVFSHIGDKIGRKKTLMLTLMLMGGATVLIGLLPDYNAIGIWAPILLVFLRLCQGLGIGGEWGGSVLLAVEYSSKKNRGFFGSIPQLGVPVGMLLGTVAISLLSNLPEEQFLSWGWRLPFILSAVLIIVGLWIRKGIEETPVFQEAKESGDIAKMPLVDTFRYHWKSVFITAGAKFVETSPYYIFATFVIAYATGYLGYQTSTVLNAVAIANLVTIFMIPLMGKLSDKVGRKPLYIGGTIAMLLFAFPYFYLLSLQSAIWLTVATIIAIGIIWAPLEAVMGTMFSEIFSTNIRYTGISVGNQLGAAVFGGTTPMVALALLNAFNDSWVPVALYIVAACIISLISLFAIREGKNLDL